MNGLTTGLNNPIALYKDGDMSNLNDAKTFEEQYPYLNIAYDSKKRFCGYWHQIDETVSLKPKKMLEIGPGNSFVANYLKSWGVDVVTLDVLEELNPDVIGSVVQIPFSDNAFDVVSCCEVLEHMPYENFNRSIKEIRRVSQKHVVLSLPDDTAIYKADIQLPGVMLIKKLISDPFPRPKPHTFDGHHYWEIGKIDYSLDRIQTYIEMAGLKIKKTYRVFERPFQRFFILSCE